MMPSYEVLSEYGRRAILIALSVLLVMSITAIVYSLAAAWTEDNQAGTALLVTSREQNDPVIIQAYVSADRVSNTDAFYCWFLLQNTTDARIENVVLDVSPLLPFPKLEIKPNRASGPILKTKPVKFASNRTKAVVGDPVKLYVAGSFEWTENGAERYRLVTVGPIVVREPTQSRLAVLSKTYVGYLKDLAIPLFIVALTIVGTRTLQQSELKRTARGLILERVREYAETHYLYLVATARRAATRMVETHKKKLSALTDDDFDLIAFHLLQLFSNTRELVNTRGGYILPDKEGEEIVATAQDLATRLINTTFAKMEPRARAVAHIGTRMDFPQFKDDALLRPAVRRFREDVKSRISSGDRRVLVIAAILSVYAATLSYELNVAYFPWKEDWPTLNLDTEVLVVLDESADSSAMDLAAKFRAYEKRQPERRKRARR